MVRNVRIQTPGSGSDVESSSAATPQPDGVPLFSKYPNKTDEALGTFQLLKENRYIDRLKDVYSAAGEVMTCDCSEHMVGGVNVACGVDSDCINRLTNVECVDDQCSCGSHCQNQRFQRNQMASVAIFQTEHKGYGMRAETDIPAHIFIVEYKGEVIDREEYKIRKEQYSDEGIKHFYFMMIQDDEIIDATKKASLGRFCNHSCDPNAYIEKWVVNKRYRMGIFAKRKILKGEEITFDYNVDRYGSEPQKCYCGAKNCVGVLGGKTQTEILRLLPYAARDALGIKSGDEKRWIKEEKKLGITISKDNVAENVDDFVQSLELKELKMGDLAKVSSCLLLPDNDVIVIDRILERFDIGSPSLPKLLHRFNRLHGLQALTSCIRTILGSESNGEKLRERDIDALTKVVRILKYWPDLSSRNTINSCELDSLLKGIAQKVGTPEVQECVDNILDAWSELQVVYRIPKRSDAEIASKVLVRLNDRRSRSGSSVTPASADIQASPVETTTVKSEKSLDRKRYDGQMLPPGWEWNKDPSSGSVYFYNRELSRTQWEKPVWPGTESTDAEVSDRVSDEDTKKRIRSRDRERGHDREKDWEKQIQDRERQRREQQEEAERIEKERMNELTSIIAEASKQPKKVSFDVGAKNGSSASGRGKSHSHREHRSEGSGEKHHSHKSAETQWKMLFGSVVPNMLKDYESRIGRNNLKNCARDITHILAQKEMKRHGEGHAVPSQLSSDRKNKVRSFVSDYMNTFLAKLESKKRKHSESSDPSTKRQRE